MKRWEAQSLEGYKILRVEEDGCVVAAAGYRLLTTMAWGRIVYIDDLIASEQHRKSGLGTLLLTHLQELAKLQACDAVHFDTGYQRHLAHLSYLRNGFRLDCHHMAWQVPR